MRNKAWSTMRIYKIIKRALIGIGVYPPLINVVNGSLLKKTIKASFTEMYAKGSRGEGTCPGSWHEYLKWKYAQGCKMEEYFNYRLWEHSWREECPWLLEHHRRELLSAFNSNELRTLLDSKIDTALLFQDYFGREIFVYNPQKSEVENRRTFDRFITNCSGYCFRKTEQGLKGKGISKINIETKETVENLYAEMKTEKLLLEEGILQHPLMARLNTTSVNTLRVLSFMKGGKSSIIYALLRMGRMGSDVDNAGSGRVFAPVDLETCKICGIARNYVLDEFPKHPDKNVPMKNYRLPIDAKQLANFVGKLNCILLNQGIRDAVVGWDVAVNQKGEYVMIEGNASADVRIAQIAFQRSFRDEYTMLIEKDDSEKS